MREQRQFLEVIDRDEAERRFRDALDLGPLGVETVALADALGRVLASSVASTVDVPGFDRANMDGFAVRAADTFGATEERPRTLRLLEPSIVPGVAPGVEVDPVSAVGIATGGMLPRGADGVVMVEHTRIDADRLVVTRPIAPGAAISFAGSDVARGEVAVFAGELLTSRETGVLAAVGVASVRVLRRPRVAILSTGDELVEPGEAPRSGSIFDSNGRILADAVREAGGEPVPLGIVRDDEEALRARLEEALRHDVVILSGGTSKGEGDLAYRALRDLPPPGVLAHGVALKPGKPVCLAATRPAGAARTRPVVILPGFPTSAVFTFHEFVAPVIRRLAGRPERAAATVRARVPMRVTSERGRTEYLLVGLVDGPSGLVAYPMGKGSGSVTTFSHADGFVTVPRHVERLDEDEPVTVTLLSREIDPADLVVIGSHCTGLDCLLERVRERGLRVKSMAVGSTAGLRAAERGECDLAGIHLLDPESDSYNRSFLSEGLELVTGYRRMQGIVVREDDGRFTRVESAEEAAGAAVKDPSCRLVNRNRGSGTRVLVDRIVSDRRPPGFEVEVRSHNAVAAAVAQRRADWGVAIEPVARSYGLRFFPLASESFDFALPSARRDRRGVRTFLEILADPAVRATLRESGFEA